MTRYVYRRLRHLIVYRVLHVDDTPHRIALGAALGLLIGLSPLMGLHMILALGLGYVLRANRAVALAVVWISNPATFVPIITFNWIVGQAIVPHQASNDPGRLHQQMSQLLGGTGNLLSGLFSADFWIAVFNLLVSLGAALWIGSVVVGLTAGVAGYLLTRHGVVWYRQRRVLRRARRSYRRAAAHDHVQPEDGPAEPSALAATQPGQPGESPATKTAGAAAAP